tara:strand:- start:643 stop:3324 length:2682 start_codon:yes stop_codon:yes gene_type:complete
MTTYYLDPENGDDNNNGTSFANRKKSLTSLKSSLAAGDSVRMIGSPDPTSLGSGAVRKRDTGENYNGTTIKSNSISYNTTTGQTTITWSESTSGGVQRGHNLTTGDVIGIYGNSESYGNINGTWDVTVVDYQTFKLDGFTATSSGTGSGGYFTNMTGRLVRLASAATQTIACTGARTATWTASSNVTTSHATNTSPVWSQQGKVIEHDRSDEIVWNSSFTTGKAAYFQLPSALNLSGYEQISLYVKNTQNGGLTSGHFSLRLCTDTTGDTSVHTIDLTQRGSGNYYWSTVVKDFGSALNSSIQSVALYVDRNEGASGVRLSNIIACKAKSSADSITHESLIGLNTTADPDWFVIESIVGDRVLLHGSGRNNMASDLPIGYYYRNHSLGWSASNSSATIYKRECVRADLNILTQNDISSSYYWNDLSSTSGSNGNPITLSGGWDRTSMSSQNLSMSYINYVLSEGRGFYASYSNHWSISKIGVVNATTGMEIQNSNYWTELSDVSFVGNQSNGLYMIQMHDYGIKKLTVTHSNQNGYRGVFLYQIRFKASNGISATDWTTEARYDEDRDNFKIRATSNGYGSNIYLSDQSAHMPQVFKYLQADAYGDGASGISIQNHLAPLEVETADVRQNLPNGSAGIRVFGTSTGTKTFHTVNGQNSKNILSCENTGAILVADTVNGDVTYGTQSWPGGYPGENGECLYANNGEIHIKTAGTFKSRVQCNNSGKIFLKNTTGQYLYGGTLWYLNQQGSVYLLNSLGESMAYYTGSSNYIKPDTSNRRTNSGYAWKFYAPNSSSSLSHYVAKVAVNSGSQASISVYVYWGSYGAPTKLGLRVDGSNVGLSDSLTGYWSSGTYSWTQVTVNFTPTVAGYVDVYLEFAGNGGSTPAYFDDMSATQ